MEDRAARAGPRFRHGAALSEPSEPEYQEAAFPTETWERMVPGIFKVDQGAVEAALEPVKVEDRGHQ